MLACCPLQETASYFQHPHLFPILLFKPQVKLASPYGDELPAKGFDPGMDTYQAPPAEGERSVVKVGKLAHRLQQVVKISCKLQRLQPLFSIVVPGSHILALAHTPLPTHPCPRTLAHNAHAG